jgi:LysR family transcriptional regulator, low CO2-responsive transcriptional regulator
MARPPVLRLEPLDARRLLAFAQLARTGSFAAVAQSLNVSPSAVSHSIKTLEGEVEAELFDRRGHRALLTPAGERLLPYAEKILQEMVEAREQLALLNQWGAGSLRLAASASACQYFLPAVLLEFRECFPECALSVAAADGPAAMELVRSGAADLALAVVREEPAGLGVQPLFADEVVFVVSPQHAWASLPKVSRKDLTGQRVIVYNRQSATSKMILEHLARLDFDESGVVELGSMEAIKEMAKVGLGAGAVASWVAAKELEAGTLKLARLGGPPLHRQWAALWPAGRKLSVMAETLIGLCETVTASLATPPVLTAAAASSAE